MPNVPGIFQIGSYEMIVVQVLLLAGVIGAITAKAKGRSGFVWFILSVVSCGAGILVVLFLPVVKNDKTKPAESNATSEANNGAKSD